MADLNKFCNRMRYWCAEANLGYDQSNRWDIRVGGECDCSSLVYWCLWEAGFLKKPSGNLYAHTLYTGSLKNHLVAAGWKAIKPNGNPQKGDILLSEQHHVAAWLGDCLAQASIDERGRATGGQSGDQSGRETNLRSYYSYPWDWYMRYVGSSSSATTTTKKTTTTTKKATSSASTSKTNLEVDGLWGKATTTALQKALGTPVDGIVSGQSSADLKKCNRGGLQDSSWKIGTGGSMMVRALQKKVGSAVDGYFGVNTCKALQKYLGTTVDGYVDKPSDMVKALQRKLNAGKF